MEYHLDALHCVPAGLLVTMLIAGVQHHSDTSLPPPTRANKYKTFFSSSLAVDPHHLLDPRNPKL